MFQRTTALASAPIVQASAEIASPTHTPLPWRTDPNKSLRIVAGDDDTVASVGSQASLREQWEGNALLIVKAVNTRQALLARIARLEADLLECREYLETEVDVIDGDYGVPAPNRAMTLVSMIDESLHGPGAF